MKHMGDCCDVSFKITKSGIKYIHIENIVGTLIFFIFCLPMFIFFLEENKIFSSFFPFVAHRILNPIEYHCFKENKNLG